MGETIPPVSKSQPASDHDDDYAHEAVTIAPPAPNFEHMLRQLTPSPVPSLSNRSDQHFRAALDAGERAGSSLSDLSKIVRDLSGGLSGAKQANEQLVHELSTLRAMLGSASEQQLGLRHQLAELEQELAQTKSLADQELAQTKSLADQERRFLTDQHDDFLSALLEEHEEALREATEGDARRMSDEVSSISHRLAQAETARQLAETEQARAREALAKAHAQRDEAQARAEKLERERDELRAEASLLRARLGTHRTASTVPPPPVLSRPPSFRPPPALQLDAGELDSTLHARSAASPRLPSVIPRFTPAPPELERAVVSSAREFPRESTRPGVGGPKPSRPPVAALPRPDFGPPPSGWTPVPPAPAPGPARRPAVFSAASMPPSAPGQRPVLKQKPDPTTRPLIDYSLGGDGLPSETLEGVRLTSKPPKK